MLRFTALLLRVQSHQKKRAQHPNAGTRYGRVYNRGFIRYGFGGFGMSVYSPKKNRNFRVRQLGRSESQPAPGSTATADDLPLSSMTRSLSPNFRSFALADGGVFVSHPSHAEVLRWGQGVLTAETNSATSPSTTSMDRWIASRMQSIIADNTIENVSLSQWRRAHMWNVVKAHGRIQRRWGTPDFVKGARTTLYGN